MVGDTLIMYSKDVKGNLKRLYVEHNLLKINIPKFKRLVRLNRLNLPRINIESLESFSP